MSYSLCYDGYNQSAHTEVSMTLRSANGGGERNDDCPKVAYGFSHSNSNTSMQTKPKEECAMTLRSAVTGEGAFPSLCHNGGEAGQNQQAVLASLSQMRYIVRRLTPTEAERLMGLPDGYLIPAGLRRYFDENGEPPPELVDEFVERFDTFNAIMAAYEHKAPPKGKSRKRVADWLKKISDAETCPDSPRYKGCGNSWASNQPRWILTRLLALGEHIDPFTGEEDAPCS